ncbi:NADPH-dependent 1-acyldihydroxyacetone phosphate reductase [Lasiodiplodia theobromae]|uniref:NADPH-dependent 1-acyldihydroxyacetone phosphate reductase n=1 Tax=Lasiodiplodia theobromae TaxID=45133 RepID=A0A5N5D2P6_9PEZI|nr:NADPH-dependent 1-acyldihydroxyacetone phosphate reductase [Lasiodiplodia theobromae]
MASRQHFALVTGCVEGGIGEALTKEFAAKGLHVIATVLPGETRVHLDNPDITTFELDVTKEETILSLKDNVAELTSGKLDVLVNNA